MGIHINAAIELSEHDFTVIPMQLPRAARGLTHSAIISVGDRIDFDGLTARVEGIIHQHVSHKTDRAPNTIVRVSFDVALLDREVEILRLHGFE